MIAITLFIKYTGNFLMSTTDKAMQLLSGLLTQGIAYIVSAIVKSRY